MGGEAQPRPPLYFENPASNAVYSPNADAMLLAEILHLPTVNGLSTFTPPDGHFVDDDHEAYLSNIRTYAARHAISGLCGLDLRNFRWSIPDS